MGKGLSDIQSTILCLAHKNRVQMDRNQAEVAELRRQLKEERTLLDRDIMAYHGRVNTARRKELIGKIRPLANEISRRRRETNTDLSHHEVLVNHWGWRPATKLFRPNNERFSPSQVGAKVYNAALASLSRAVARLEKRGLVVRRQANTYGPWGNWPGPAGIDLTDRGLEEAIALNLSTHKCPREQRSPQLYEAHTR